MGLCQALRDTPKCYHIVRKLLTNSWMSLGRQFRDIPSTLNYKPAPAGDPNPSKEQHYQLDFLGMMIHPYIFW